MITSYCDVSSNQYFESNNNVIIYTNECIVKSTIGDRGTNWNKDDNDSVCSIELWLQ